MSENLEEFEVEEIDSEEESKEKTLPTKLEEVPVNKETEGKTEERLIRRPEFVIMQPDTDQAGGRVLRRVGVMWRTEGRNGKIYYTLKIGDLRLLVFKNEPRE